MALITRADVVRFAKITTTLTPDQETTIDDMLAAATPVIERYTGPVELGSRWYVGPARRGKIVVPWPFTAVLSVKLDGVLISADQYDGETGASHGIIGAALGVTGPPWAVGTTVEAVVSVGSATVPGNVRLAALELVSYWWQSTQQAQRSVWTDAGAGGVPMGFAVPNRVVELLAPRRALPGFG